MNYEFRKISYSKKNNEIVNSYSFTWKMEPFVYTFIVLENRIGPKRLTPIKENCGLQIYMQEDVKCVQLGNPKFSLQVGRNSINE